MGVNICIFANHNIKGKSFSEKLSDFEGKMQKKVHFLPNFPFRVEHEPTQTTVVEDVIFYIITEYGYAEDYFNKVGEIYIHTDYQHLKRLTLLEKTMRTSPSVSTNATKWLDNLSRLEIFGNLYNAEYENSWAAFQKFQSVLVKKMGGNKVVYIDDASFQTPMNLFYEGKSMEEVFPEILKIEKLFDIEILYHDFRTLWDDDRLRGYGFYENI